MQHTLAATLFSSGGGHSGVDSTTRASWHPRCGPKTGADIGVAAVIHTGPIDPRRSPSTSRQMFKRGALAVELPHP